MNKQQMYDMLTGIRNTTLNMLQTLEAAEVTEQDPKQKKDIMLLRKKQLDSLAMLDAMLRNYKTN